MGCGQSEGCDSTSWASVFRHAGAALDLAQLSVFIYCAESELYPKSKVRHLVRCNLQHGQQECDGSMSVTSRLLVCLKQNFVSCMAVDTFCFRLKDDYETIVAPTPAVVEAV